MVCSGRLESLEGTYRNLSGCLQTGPERPERAPGRQRAARIRTRWKPLRSSGRPDRKRKRGSCSQTDLEGILSERVSR